VLENDLDLALFTGDICVMRLQCSLREKMYPRMKLFVPDFVPLIARSSFDVNPLPYLTNLILAAL
jgi:hypothetical protein